MPTYTISAPDGNTYSVTGPDGASQQDVQNEVLRQHPEAATAKSTSAVDRVIDTAKNLYGSFLEPAAVMASSAVAKPASGIAGLAGIVGDATGIAPNDPAATQAAVQKALTYVPRTAAGKQSTAALGKILSPVGYVADSLGQGAANYYGGAAKLLGAPDSVVSAVRSGANALGQETPTLLGAKIPEIGAAKVADAALPDIASIPMQQAAASTKALGYKLSPNSVGANGGILGRNAANLTGNAALDDALTLYNQTITNKIAKAEVGIPDNVPLTQGSIDAAKADAGQAYDAVRNAESRLVLAKDANGNPVISTSGKPVVKQAGPVRPDDQFVTDVKAIAAGPENPSFATPVDAKVQALKDRMNKIASSPYSPGDSLNEIGSLRKDARTNLKNTGDTEKLALGQAQMQAADALEGQMERYLQTTGQTDLYNNFTAARQRLAKLHSVDEAFTSGVGVNPDALSRIADRKGGFVAGGLKGIVDSNKNFGNVVRSAEDVRPPGLSAVDLIGGLANPKLLIGTALRPIVREALQTPLYQRVLGRGPNTTASALAQLAAKPVSAAAGALMSPPDGSE